MIFLTGDIHGDPKRFSNKNFPEQRNLTKDDYVIILGDFGVIWNDKNIKEEQYWIKWLEEKPFTTLFIDGNHEGFERLCNYPEEIWHGGKVHKISNSIYHLMRGQVFTIDNKTFFTFGGAKSHDISAGILDRKDPDFKKKKKKLDKDPYASYRILNESWWELELPTNEEINEARQTIENIKEVDYILTHTPSFSVYKSLDFTEKPNILTSFLDEVDETLKYKIWFCGHIHVDRKINENTISLYEQIIQLK